MNSRRLAAALAVTLLWTVSVYARDDGGEKYNAPPDIAATLPKYCWWLYMDNIPNTEEFNIHYCGASWNHYCPGLVKIKEAEREKDLSKRYRFWEIAKGEMQYTITHTPPDCWLQPRAKLNLSRIQMEMDTLKIQLRRR
jgi:hypothetical protein